MRGKEKGEKEGKQKSLIQVKKHVVYRCKLINYIAGASSYLGSF